VSEQVEDSGGSMEFTARGPVLAALADWVMPAVPSGTTTLAIGGCLRVTASPGGLRLFATDLQRAITAETPAVTVHLAGEAFIPARKLKAMLAEVPDGEVTVTVKDGSAAVTAGSATWQLRLPAPRGYPEFPDLSGAEFAPVDRKALLAALAAVRHAAGRDSGRPAFTQVSLAEHDGAMHATALDSSRFARAPAPGFPFPVCIPGPLLDGLARLLDKSEDGEVSAAVTSACVVFRAGPVTLAALLMTAVFPDAGRPFLLPAAACDLELGVDKADLAAALRRVRINADASTSAVALTAASKGGRGTLTVAARDKGGNSAEQVIPADWSGDRLRLVVNAGFLDAMLAAHPAAECKFRVGRANGRQQLPLLLEDAGSGVTAVCYQMDPRLAGKGEA
jgi:DNA polymerase III sliding clamp (beta) subunit (PCNA family)